MLIRIHGDQQAANSQLKVSLPVRTQRAVDLAREKGASSWLTAIPLKDMNFDLSKRHNEIRDLEAELLDMVCYDVAIEPTLQPLAGEELNRRANKAPDARLDVHCRGFRERQRAAFFYIRVCHPNADLYKEISSKQIHKLHEDGKKRKYASRIIEVENGTFTPLVFTTTGGMSQECQRYDSRLAALIPSKKQEDYATTIAWIRTKVSFALLWTALVCLRGTRSRRRKTNAQEHDLEIKKGLAGLT